MVIAVGDTVRVAEPWDEILALRGKTPVVIALSERTATLAVDGYGERDTRTPEEIVAYFRAKYPEEFQAPGVDVDIRFLTAV